MNPATQPRDAQPVVAVFTRTTGYRHDSIPAAVTALRELGAGHRFTVVHTEDPAELTRTVRDGCAAVVFASTSGAVLDQAGRAALEHHVRTGGGFLALHSAAGTETDWPFYGELLGGARFVRHPELQPATVTVEDRGHPATAHLPEKWDWVDEWYDFSVSPRPTVRVLASIDERGYLGGGMGADHPLIWHHQVDDGRCFVTALGHTAQAYLREDFRDHLLGALTWAARLPAPHHPPSPSPG